MFSQKNLFEARCSGNYYYFCTCIIKQNILMAKNLNRIKAVLTDKQRTNKWLAEQLDKDPATVSKWCTNSCQPSLETLINIAKVLEVDMNELIKFEN